MAKRVLDGELLLAPRLCRLISLQRSNGTRGRARAIVRAAIVSLSLGLFGASFAADEIHWTITGPTSVSFDWRGSASESAIAYGLDAGNYTSTVTAENPTGTCVPFSSDGPFWEARLTGLSPDTLYHYSIANGPDHTFRTPPAPGTANFSILVEADIGDGDSYPNVVGVQQQMAQEAGARFALVVGDLTYSDDHGQSHVDEHFNDVMAWSQDLAYMPAWGNHEWDSEPADDLRNYKGRFDFPNPQTSVGTPPTSDCGEDWYWFDYGNARFIAYPEPWTGAWADWKAKATLVMNEAQEDPNISWIVTYGHRPAYSSGYHPGSTTLQDYLGELAATHGKYVLNLNGHGHDYERTYPQNGSGDNLHGAVHITVGTGGATLETVGPCLWLTCAQPSWSAVRYFHLGYLRLSFSSSSIQGEFICGPNGSGTTDITCTPGSVIDSFNIVPSGPYPTIYVDQADPNCSANGPGTATEPLCTITQGVNRAVAGNTVIVKAGTYPEYVKVTKSGTGTQPIVIMAEPGANVVVSGQFHGFELLNRSWVTIRGFTVSDTSSYGIYVSNSSHIVIADNRVTRAGQPIASLTRYGIELANTTDSVVSGNTTDHNTDAGIALIGGTTGVTVENNVSFANARGYMRAAPGIDVRSGGNTLRGNVVHDNEDSGIQIFSSGGNPSPNNLLVNNLCYDNGDHGIDVSSAGGQRIIGNDVYRNATSGINVEGPSGGTTLSNNISVDNAIGSTGTKGNIRVDPASVAGTTLDYDLVYMSTPAPTIVWNSVSYNTLAAFTAATGREAHGREAAPQWIAPAAGNFRLAAGSPAIDAADSGAVGASDTDIEGRPRVDNPLVADTGAGPRTYDDIGAYEHPLCGNGIKEDGEDCDGFDTGIAVCGELGCSGGDPSCTAQCTLDYSTCTGCPVCGNGIKEAGEDCDGGDLGGSSCESLGQCSIGGGLACANDCHFDTAGCSCGDNTVQGGCGEACDGTDLAGQTCVSLGLGGGTLSCRTDCTGFVTSDCSICGDGIRQGVEECDGANLGGATCGSHGCFAGTPTCTGSCGLDYASCSNCWGGTLYVNQANPACSDAGQGTAAAPFCTINGAAVKVVAGGTVIVASGTYSEYVKVLSSGTPTSPILFKTAPGATVNVTGQLRGFELIGRSWVTIEGFNVFSTAQYGIYVKSCANVSIRNNHVSHAGLPASGSTFAGISVSETADSLISGNTTEDNSDSGIYLNSNVSNVTVEGNVSARNARVYIRAASGIEVRSPGNIVRGNVCHDNEDSGIAVKPFSAGVPAPDNLIVNNATYGNAVHGIAISASQSQRIVGNTVYANGDSGIDLSGASSQAVIANNIVVDNATSASASVGNIRVDSGSTTGTTLDYDLVYRSEPGTIVSWGGTAYPSLAVFSAVTGKESHGIQSAPMWVSPANADFRLRIGSPAIDSADSSVSGAQGTDINGIVRIDEPVTPDSGAGPRAYDDRGAYEYPLDADNDGYVSVEDCDDMNAAVNPGMPDDNCDGVDNNCNAQSDEGFASAPTTCGIGPCAATGQTSCVNHVLTDTCMPGTPAADDATCDGIDDDCSGQADEDFVATPTACGTGACAASGQNVCVNGIVTDNCTPGTPAADDATCDGIDDDCSGQVDEDFVATPTACGVGPCVASGQNVCVNGVLTDTCTPGTPAADDATCDGIDDDCSGQADEDFVATPTACGTGACAASGQNVCVNGVVTDNCTPGTPASDDATCDGIDDDCSGQVDEDFVATPTACGVGPCAAAGQNSCVNGVVTDNCAPGTPAADDATCDGIDDDCSGQADEDFVATPTACGIGACLAPGQNVCVNGVLTDNCTPGTPASDDATCDGIDDDCSGQVDEDFVATPTACGVGPCAAAGQNSCVNGVVTDNCAPGTPAADDATCDGIDDDCSGQVDEDFVATPTACGVGPCAAAGQNSCVNGVVTDNCAPGTPAADDATCDGIDDDCSGQADEDFVATPTACGIGACLAPGQNVCVNGVVTDNCTPGAPAADDATCDGIDDDCSGQADEDFVATPTACGIGACLAPGQNVCVNGVVTDNCTPGTPASDDATCDGIDDDCSGQVDEDFVATPTACGVGPCVASGQNVCVNGVVTDNCTPGAPAADDTTCDGIDDDCSGQADEDFVATPTACGTGACAASGQNVCVNGVLTDNCTPGTPAADDATCDGIDDDCSGQADEDFVATPTACGIGACLAAGQNSCVNGVVTDNCTPGAPAADDTTCDGIDDDCSGQADEDFVATPTACGTGTGACAASGQNVCVNGVVTDTCTPGTPASDDATCDGIDDDCSGQTDEDFVATPTACGTGACAASGQNVCVNGVVTDTCTPGTPASDDATCDGIDDDCSGQTDEDFVATSTACGTGACAASGQNVCVNGVVTDTCTPGTPASDDATCDGIDDDCSGQTDEDFVATPSACGVGPCAVSGQNVCVNGVLTDNCTPGTPASDDATCDGIDDDCSGQADEDFVATPTACGIGACLAAGQNSCVNGVVTDTCTPGTPASDDATCDGIDDDCSGQADEDFVATPTACGVGACVAAGQSICVNGTLADTCLPGTPVPEVGCDGIDNDCNPASPDVRDGDGDTVSCAVDCDDSDPSVYPGAAEINDGIDNQCPGSVGYGLIDEISGDSGFHTPGGKLVYSWTPQSGATDYEVARANARDFTAGCQSIQTSSSQWNDLEVPSVGEVFYYVNRPVAPSTGSWGARSSGAQRTVSCSLP